MSRLDRGAECRLGEAADLNALRAELRSVPDGLAAYDTALRCIHISDVVARYGFGRRPDEIVGHTLCDAAPDVAPTLEPLLRQVLETDEPLVRVEFSGETPSAPGQPWHWLGDIYPLRNSVGKTIAVGVLGMDGTQGKRAEDKQAEFVIRERSAQQRLAFLAEATQLVASSRDYENIARRVTNLSVPILGEWCAVHALKDGRIRAIAHKWAVSTDQGELPPPLRTNLSAAQDPPPAVAQVLRTGMSLQFSLGGHSCMVVALTAGGRTLGTLSFGARDDRPYGPEDLALAEDLARRYAQAVDSAHLQIQAERRMRELEALYCADAALHQSLHLDEVLQALVWVAADILEADKAMVFTWDSKRQQLIVGAARGFGDESIRLMVFQPGEGITGRAVAGGEPIVVHDVHSDPRVPPHLRAVVRDEHIRTLVSVPIRVSDEVVGVFNVIFTVPRVVNANDRRLMLALAQRAAVAIGNARLYELAQQAIRAREEFLAATSHELRNPLGNIKSLVSTLQRTDVDWDESTRREFLGDIERETDRMGEFVEDLLDIARLDDAGIDTGRRTSVAPSALVDAGLDRVRHMLIGRSVFLGIPDDLPAVEVDADRLEQVVANLVENAAKYSPAGTPIYVIGRLVGDEVQLAVEDEGVGVAAEHLERIFDRFFRARVVDDVPGTGLGLAICRAIVEAEGGSIWAQNRPSGGASFVISLPLRAPGSRVRGYAPAAPAAA